jgi:N-acetylmuramoyl-L-alanine amidase
MRSVFLAAGHSDKDPGVCTRTRRPDGGTVLRREADIAVEFRNMVHFYLDRWNQEQAQAGGSEPPRTIRIGTDGVGTENLPLQVAAAQAREYDIAVEFHCNGFHLPTARGTEVLSAPKDKVLAARLSAAVSKGLGTYDRGAKPENAGQHHRLAFVRAGGMIVELFFLTNHEDLEKYDARKWLAAKAVAEELALAAAEVR